MWGAGNRDGHRSHFFAVGFYGLAGGVRAHDLAVSPSIAVDWPGRFSRGFHRTRRYSASIVPYCPTRIAIGQTPLAARIAGLPARGFF